MKKHNILILFIFCYSFCILNSAFGQGGTWTWISGSNQKNSSGVYGTQGVPSVNNYPPGMYEPCEWKDNNGNLWIYGGWNIDLYSDLWKYNPLTNEWTWVKGTGALNVPANYGTIGVPASANTPGQRSVASATWVDNSGNLWLFGGENINDLWKYDISTNNWTWVSGTSIAYGNGMFGSKGVPSVFNIPGGLAETASSWTDASNNLWLFGGSGIDLIGNLGCLNDLWKYNIATNEWTWMKGSAMASAPANYGTKGIAGTLNDPGGRYTYTKWKDLQGSFWIMGGADDNIDLYNDLWKYDPATNNWTWMDGPNVRNNPGSYQSKCANNTLNTPKSRIEQRSAVTDNCGRFWLFGGAFLASTGITSYYNDLWIYDPANSGGRWKWLSGTNIGNQPGNYGTKGVSSVTNEPPSRWGAVAWWGNNNKFYMFGGSQNDIFDSYSDLWVFNPDTTCIQGCTTSLPVATFASSDTAFCGEAGKCIDFFDYSTGNPSGWKWSFPGALPDSSTMQNPTNICYYNTGTFAVTLVVTNAGGSDTLTVSPMITVGSTPPPPVITISGDTLKCSNASAYQWYFNGAPISGATNFFYVTKTAGNYSVQITDIFGCIRLSGGVFASVNERDNSAFIKLYPNPVRQSLLISYSLPVSKATMTVYDILGTKVFQSEMTNQKSEIDVSGLTNGVYIFEINNNAKVYRTRFLKE